MMSEQEKYEEDCRRSEEKWMGYSLIFLFVLLVISILLSFVVPDSYKPVTISFVAGSVFGFIIFLSATKHG